jgi:hypothetical protein
LVSTLAISCVRDLGTTVEVRDGVQPGDRIMVVLNPRVDLAAPKVHVHPEPST